MGKTRGVHETTPELRNRMVGMYEAGLGLRDIAAAVNCSQRTVKRWLNRFDKEGTVETRERCGRKRATTSEEDSAIIRLATQTPLTAAKAVLPALGLTCSVDTIRERLHKAGIHNWSPSRKHMQRIPLGEGDSATVQQAVWRPTGTQLGKKKLGTKESGAKSKKNGSLSLKKKGRVDKTRSREAFGGDGAPGVDLKQPTDPAQFVFSQQSAGQQEISQNLAPANNEIPDDSLRNNQTQFDNALSLVQSSQPEVYQHHSGMNVAQNWPLDLVQGSHHYPQGQPRSMSHEQPPPQQQLQELHTPREQEHQVQHQQQEVHDQPMHSHHQSLQQHQPQHHPVEPQIHQQRRISSELKIVSRKDCPEKIVRSDSCSNSSSSNDQMSDMDELSKDDSRDDTEGSHSGHARRKKKGGKAKGTLETSVEIRNRMIGMSEAGLSTLSIALAINRSERTVKRWLERWNKEGNVQTKERKGRRRITTKEQDDAIIAMATQHPLTAAKHVAPALGLNCSVDTIRERLHKAGIHSWKLGKKQGEGNAVHTVHLWQPSGNRPNKPKPKSEKRKKSSPEKKRDSSSSTTPKKSQQKKKSVEEPKILETPSVMVAPAMQFHDNGPLTNYVPGPEIMQPVHNLSASLVPPSSDPQISSSVPQTMQIMGPMMQQRQDCRMANSIIQHDQANPSVVYSSCMINAANPHMDQPDPLNYEPYIWSF